MDNWNDGELANEVVRWRPITPIGRGGIRIGITDQYEWIMEANGNIGKIAGISLVGMLPILEMTASDFYQLLENRARGYSDIAIDPGSFPIDDVIKIALQSSFYWQSLALDWLEAGLLSETFIEPLRLLQERRLHQRTTFRIRKLLKTLEQK